MQQIELEELKTLASGQERRIKKIFDSSKDNPVNKNSVISNVLQIYNSLLSPIQLTLLTTYWNHAEEINKKSKKINLKNEELIYTIKVLEQKKKN